MGRVVLHPVSGFIHISNKGWRQVGQATMRASIVEHASGNAMYLSLVKLELEANGDRNQLGVWLDSQGLKLIAE